MASGTDQLTTIGGEVGTRQVSVGIEGQHATSPDGGGVPLAVWHSFEKSLAPAGGRGHLPAVDALDPPADQAVQAPAPGAEARCQGRAATGGVHQDCGQHVHRPRRGGQAHPPTDALAAFDRLDLGGSHNSRASGDRH